MVCIYADIAIYTLAHQPSCTYIYIYVNIAQDPKSSCTSHQVLQKAEVSMIQQYNRVLQKLLQAAIKKYLDSTSTVLTKQHYQLLLPNPTQWYYIKISFGYLHIPGTGLIAQCFRAYSIGHDLCQDSLYFLQFALVPSGNFSPHHWFQE